MLTGCSAGWPVRTALVVWKPAPEVFLMLHHDGYLDNDEQPRSSSFAAGVVGGASEI